MKLQSDSCLWATSHPSFTRLASGLVKRLGTGTAGFPKLLFSFSTISPAWLQDSQNNYSERERETKRGISHITIYDLALGNQAMSLLLFSISWGSCKILPSFKGREGYRPCILMDQCQCINCKKNMWDERYIFSNIWNIKSVTLLYSFSKAVFTVFIACFLQL